MKRNYILQTLVLLLFVFIANAQQGINYKAIIKDADGNAIASTEVTIQFTILESGTTEVYKETHTPTTDAHGIIIVNIGEGTVLSGDFKAINWGGNPHFLKTEIDKGDGLIDMGTTEFKTVPYALHAKTAEDAVTKAYLDNILIQIIETNKLLDAGYSIEQLIEGGHSIGDLLASGANLSDLLDLGISLSDLIAAGVDISSLISNGVSIFDLYNEGVEVSDLLSAGASYAELIDIGVSHDILMRASNFTIYNIQEMLAAGFELSEFVEFGVPYEILLFEGVSVCDLVDAGANIYSMLYNSVCGPGDLFSCGVSLDEIIQTGIANASELLALGVSIADFEAANMSIADMFFTGAQYYDFIGLEYAGGVIFDISSDGSGYVASLNIEDGYKWGCAGTDISGAQFSNEVNLGYDNTIAINDACQEIEIAAKVCADYEVGNYNDWFLPCWKRMELLIYNLSSRGIEAFSSDFYWSSSQLDEELAVGFDLPPVEIGNLAPIERLKEDEGRVIPVRFFQQNH